MIVVATASVSTLGICVVDVNHLKMGIIAHINSYFIFHLCYIVF